MHRRIPELTWCVKGKPLFEDSLYLDPQEVIKDFNKKIEDALDSYFEWYYDSLTVVEDMKKILKNTKNVKFKGMEDFKIIKQSGIDSSERYVHNGKTILEVYPRRFEIVKKWED